MTEKEYKSRIRKKLGPLLNERNNNLTEIASMADGVSPMSIVDIIGRSRFNLDNKRNKFNRNTTFPEPNPVDFEWRFTEESSSLISNLLDFKKYKIGCFGVPSVHYKVLEKNVNSILFDINPFISYDKDEKSHIVCNINSDKLEGYEFDKIILDPPWYLYSYSVWLKQAINNLKEGGIIYITKIPSLTRPTAENEWRNLLNEFHGVLEITDFSFKVFYETPFFELETFDYNEIGNIGNWRNTTIVSFRLVKKKNYYISQNSVDTWKRMRFGNKIVSLKMEVDDNQFINIKSPYTDGTFTLKSVSNREFARQKINFLTSRNKALIIEGTNKVCNFLKVIEKENNLVKALSGEYNNKEVEYLKIIHALIGS